MTETAIGAFGRWPASGDEHQVCNTAAMHPVIIAVGAIVALALAALFVHLTLTWMAARGWVYYRPIERQRPTSLGFIEEVFHPSMEHVIDEETRDKTEADQKESGEEL